MANRPNLVTEGSAILKGKQTPLYLFGGNVEAEGKVISGVTIRKDTPKGDVLAIGITLVWVVTETKRGYKLDQEKLKKYYIQIVTKSQQMEAREWMPFVNAISKMLEGKKAEDFKK